MNAQRRSRTRIQLDSDELRMASGAADTADRSTSTPAESGALVPSPSAGVPHNPDAKEGEAYPGEPTIKIGTVLPAALKGQLDGFVRYAQDTGDVDGITTAVDVFRIAIHRYIQQAQKQYNDGEPFRAPRVNRRGRPVRPR